jgi:hypothetical protein
MHERTGTLDVGSMVDIARLPGALDLKRAYPRLNWKLVCGWIATHVPELDREAAYATAQRQWLWRFRPHLPIDYSVFESTQTLLLAPKILAPRLLAKIDRHIELIAEALGGWFDHRAVGRYLVLVLPDRSAFSIYNRVLDPEFDSEQKIGGVCYRGGLVHIVSHADQGSLEHVVTHELTHACLCRVNLPKWLEEGIAERFSMGLNHARLGGLVPPPRSDDVAFWRRSGLREFWSGTAWTRKGELRDRSYYLAEALVEEIARDPGTQIRAFLKAASPDDGGAAAAAQFLGMTLDQLAERYFAKAVPRTLRNDFS